MKKYIVLYLLPVLAVFASGCYKGRPCIKGSGPVVEQEMYLPDMNGVHLSVDAHVHLMPGDTQIVVVKGQQNIINDLETYVSNGVWNIGFRHCVRNYSSLDIYITAPEISYAVISGSGSIETSDIFITDNEVYLKISGSGSIYGDFACPSIESSISGSGNISLAGSADIQKINISGSGSVYAFGMNTLSTYVTISGSGNAEVNATEFLNVNISGSGSVFYKGYPELSVSISGSGGVFNAN